FAIMTHDKYLFLVVRKALYHTPKVEISLFTDHPCFRALIRKMQHVEYIETVAVYHHWRAPLFPIVINNQVVRNPHHPSQELPFLVIATTPQGIDHFNKGILEDILCQTFVFHQ